MPDRETAEPLFGDVLARTRATWVKEMARRLEIRGHQDYRRSDALSTRVLARGVLPLAAVVGALGASRQAARKVVDALVERGFADVASDPVDARRRVVALTDAGRGYAADVRAVLEELQHEVASLVSNDELRVATDVLVRVTRYFSA